jgi:hypothetical protein
MRIINSSTDQHFKFSIDGHEMIVQAADFVAIQPYSQSVLDIAIGTPSPGGFRGLTFSRTEI